jgi:hypothetical protein
MSTGWPDGQTVAATGLPILGFGATIVAAKNKTDLSGLQLLLWSHSFFFFSWAIHWLHNQSIFFMGLIYFIWAGSTVEKQQLSEVFSFTQQKPGSLSREVQALAPGRCSLSSWVSWFYFSKNSVLFGLIVVVHICNTSHSESWNSRIAWSSAKKQSKVKGLGTWLKWYSTCLASVRPWV